MPSYKVRPGRKFGRANEYNPGDIVELSAHEAAPLLGETLDEVQQDQSSESFQVAPEVVPQGLQPEEPKKRSKKSKQEGA